MFIHIVSEPIFECYKILIDYAFKKSKSFLLHIQEKLSVDDSVFRSNPSYSLFYH
ncbi:MAG: hypothetical protein RIN55_08070 [Tissierellaceae bacterium]|nr:hypothetical protein [Tissierellaceae bacterium]